MRWAIGFALLLLAGCVSQSELALSQNVYRLDLNARGSIGISEAQSSAQRRAAELTLSKGYTHYIIADAKTYEGSSYVGNTPVYGTMNSYGYGSVNLYGGQPIVQRRSNTSLIIVMFHEAEAPPNALDARQIVEES
ncbi:MAG TPA: hypothetical protein VIK75_10080 [Calditerricola sp.]